MLKVLSRSHTEMKTYYILHIIYVRNGSIDICVFIIIFERSQTNTHINIYWRITNASLPNSESSKRMEPSSCVCFIYSFVYEHSVLWIFFDFFFFFFWCDGLRMKDQGQSQIERMKWRTKRKKKGKEKATFAWNREQKNMKRKKNAHNKMICYAPVAYGIRKIDCFLIIKTTEHIYILILLGPVPLLSVYRSISFLPIACTMQSVNIPKSVLLLSFNWLYFNGTGNGNAIRIHIIGAGKHMKFGPGDLSILSPD